MRYGKDKVSDVIAVLKVIKKDIERATSYRDISEIRRDAINEIAEDELRKNRYKNIDSAQKTIHDACARRLRPDVSNIAAFDKLAEEALRKDSPKLKEILLAHSENYSQRMLVNNFFD